MPENQYLKHRLAAIQQSLMSHHLGGRGLPNAVAGAERGTFLREFLQKVFPSHYCSTHGVITDSFGAISWQVDLAVECLILPSFPMPSGDQRLLERPARYKAFFDFVRVTRTTSTPKVRRGISPKQLAERRACHGRR